MPSSLVPLSLTMDIGTLVPSLEVANSRTTSRFFSGPSGPERAVRLPFRIHAVGDPNVSDSYRTWSPSSRTISPTADTGGNSTGALATPVKLKARSSLGPPTW